MKRLRFGLLAAGIALGLVIVAGIAFGHGDRVSAGPAQVRAIRAPAPAPGPDSPRPATRCPPPSRGPARAPGATTGTGTPGPTWAPHTSRGPRDGRSVLLPEGRGSSAPVDRAQPRRQLRGGHRPGGAGECPSRVRRRSRRRAEGTGRGPLQRHRQRRPRRRRDPARGLPGRDGAVQRMLDLKPGIDRSPGPPTTGRSTGTRPVRSPPSRLPWTAPSRPPTRPSAATTSASWPSTPGTWPRRPGSTTPESPPTPATPHPSKARRRWRRPGATPPGRSGTTRRREPGPPAAVRPRARRPPSVTGHQDARRSNTASSQPSNACSTPTASSTTSRRPVRCRPRRPCRALRHAEAEWGRRHSVLVADALGWALHVNGRDAEASATRGRQPRSGRRVRSSSFIGHDRTVAGTADEARRDLSDALRINPSFSVLQAPVARAALAGLAVRHDPPEDRRRGAAGRRGAGRLRAARGERRRPLQQPVRQRRPRLPGPPTLRARCRLRGRSRANTLLVLTMLHYYVANGNKPYCDGRPPSELDRTWFGVYLRLGADPATSCATPGPLVPAGYLRGGRAVSVHVCRRSGSRRLARLAVLVAVAAGLVAGWAGVGRRIRSATSR